MDSTPQIPAQVYMSLLEGHQHGGNLPKFVGDPVQMGYGISDFFNAIARTVKKVIFPNLVRLGRSVVGDTIDGGRPLKETAQARTMEALGKIASGIQNGAGKRKRKRSAKRKKTTPRKPRKKAGKRKPKVSVVKNHRKRTRKTATISLAKLLKRS